MKMRIISLLPLIDGVFKGTISEVSVRHKNKGNTENLVVVFKPFDEDGNAYEHAQLWVPETINTTSPFARLLEVLDFDYEAAEYFNDDEVADFIKGKDVGIEIRRNTVNGNTYNNIVDVFSIDDFYERKSEYDPDEDELEEEDDDLDDEDDEELDDEESDDEDDDSNYVTPHSSFRRSNRRKRDPIIIKK